MQKLVAVVKVVAKVVQLVFTKVVLAAAVAKEAATIEITCKEVPLIYHFVWKCQH